MTRRRRLLLSLTGSAITVSLVLLGTFSMSPASADTPANPIAGSAKNLPDYETTSTTEKITTRDGIVLTSAVYKPVNAAALGPRPLIIIPSAWGGPSGQMFYSGEKLAARGFVVLSYATRGFAESEGEVTMAGPKDISDVSDIIDWAIRTQGVDGQHVGMFGVSYGAGLALLAAANDPRIRAVGSLEGFANLVQTAYPNRTRSVVLVAGLWYGGAIAGHLDKDLTAAFTAAMTGKDVEKWIPYLDARSPINVIDKLNQNHPAIWMATSWNDLAYGTDQISDFYTKYTGVKRLELRPGDHVINEVPTAIGLGDPSLYNSVWDWMTTYVGGMDTPLVHQPQIWMQPRTSTGTKPAPQTYPSWQSMTTGTKTFNLTKPTGFIPTGGVTPGTGGTWGYTIEKGFNLVGGNGAPIVNFAQETLTGIPPHDMLGLQNRANAGIWKGDKLTAPLVLRGQSTVKVNITPNRSSGTIVAYLYDAKADDGYIISHRPYTFKDVTPGKPIQLTLPLQPTAYTVPAGDALAVGISSGDPLYGDDNPDGLKMSLGSTSAFPASITVSTGLSQLAPHNQPPHSAGVVGGC